MRYLGGKERIANKICSFLESVRRPGQEFVDLTVGGCSIISRMGYPKKGYDVHKALITLYNALSGNLIELPDTVTLDDYKLAKNYDDENPLKAFIGFGCSFSGKYFGGYARSKRGDDFVKNAKNSLIKKFKTLKNVHFICDSLFNYNENNKLIYIDPPYQGTTKYSVNFDYDKFWNKVRELSKQNDVYVSEYNAPEDFECVLEIPKKLGLRKNEGGQIITTEKLFKYKG